jgi:hypothetical protein
MKTPAQVPVFCYALLAVMANSLSAESISYFASADCTIISQIESNSHRMAEKTK